MKLKIGAFAQNMGREMVPDMPRLGIPADGSRCSWWELQHVPKAEIALLNRRDAKLRGRPVCWAGDAGENEILVYPRPDREYDGGWL